MWLEAPLMSHVAGREAWHGELVCDDHDFG